MPEGTILLVEDEPDVRLAVADLLEAAGYQVSMASGFLEATRCLSEMRPSLLITDILLRGGGGGVELSALAATFGVPTLLMSGHPDYIKAQPGKTTSFLAKPFRAATLETAVRKLLDLAVHDAAADEQPSLAAGQ